MADSDNVIEINTRIILHEKGGENTLSQTEQNDNIVSTFKGEVQELNETISPYDSQDKIGFSNPDNQSIAQEAQSNALKYQIDQPKLNSGIEPANTENTSIESIKSGNEQGRIVLLIKKHPITLLALNVMLCMINLALILVCLYGLPEMPSLSRFNPGLAELDLPALIKLDLSALPFNCIDPCGFFLVVVLAIFLLVPFILLKLSTSTNHSTSCAHRAVLNRHVEENAVACSTCSTTGSFDPEEVSRWLRGETGRPDGEVSQKLGSEDQISSAKSGSFDMKNVEVTDLKMGSQNKEGKLVDFVSQNAQLVFWTGYLLTFLNAILLIICYCGMPKINTICDTAPFSIICAFIGCLIDCARNN